MPIARISDESPDERLIGSSRFNLLGQRSAVLRVFDQRARNFEDGIAPAHDAVPGSERFVGHGYRIVSQGAIGRLRRAPIRRRAPRPDPGQDMRREPEYFGERELTLIYVAKKLKHALRLEQLLADAGIDYVVEPDQYSVGTLFPRWRVGAFFYVAPDNASAARAILRGGGFARHEGP